MSNRLHGPNFFHDTETFDIDALIAHGARYEAAKRYVDDLAGDYSLEDLPLIDLDDLV